MMLPRTKSSVSKPPASLETPAIEKPVPPEPKRRTNRKPSITNLENVVESAFDLDQSMLRDTNEDQRGKQPARSMEKDPDAVKNATQMERYKEKNSDVSNKVDKSARLQEKAGDVSREVDEPQKALEAEKDVLLDTSQPGGKLEKLFKVDPNRNQSDGDLGDTEFELKRQPLLCLEKENEQMSKQPAKPSENASKVDKKEKLPGTMIWTNSEEEKPGKLTIKEAEIDKMAEGPFKPPIRSKGKVALGKEPLRKEAKELCFQSEKPTVHDSEDDHTQRVHVKQVSIDAEREKKPASKLSVEQPEKTVERGAPPKPPARVKNKSKRGVEKQYSRDTETDQDDQQMSRVVIKRNDDQPVKQSLDKKAEEKSRLERKHSEITDADSAEKVKQPVHVSETEANTKQPIKQPVKPMRKEPEQEVKMAVEPMRRKEERLMKMVTDIPLLYISEDETFLEALTDIPAAHSNDQPPASFVDGSNQSSVLPSLSATERAKPLRDATPAIDIGADDELQEAAVKIQAAFKGYKIRKDMRPIFKEVFKNQSADLHGSVSLVCILEGRPSTVRWLKNGQQIIGDHRCRIETTEAGVCTLVIKNLTANDSGIYTCEAVNKFGVISYNGNMTVVEPQKAVQKSVHPPLAAIIPLQFAPPKPDTQTKSQPQNLPQTQTEAASYVESVRVSLWEAYNLTEQQDTPMCLQERRGSSLIAASSSE